MPNVFQGNRVRLRAIEPSDWEFFVPNELDTDSGRLTDEIWFPSSHDSIRAWAEKQAKRPEGEAFRFAIETLDGAFAGTINTDSVNPRCGTFMYGLAIPPEQRRKGYASDAIRVVLRYYFHERRYQKVNAEVYSFNIPSQHLHGSLGFTLEGRLRRMIYSGGSFHDALIYGMTREEFDGRWPL